MVSKAEELKHVAAMKKAGVPQKYVKEEAAEAADSAAGHAADSATDPNELFDIPSQ